jgi:hypothetical protein
LRAGVDFCKSPDWSIRCHGRNKIEVVFPKIAATNGNASRFYAMTQVFQEQRKRTEVLEALMKKAKIQHRPFQAAIDPLVEMLLLPDGINMIVEVMK